MGYFDQPNRKKRDVHWEICPKCGASGKQKCHRKTITGKLVPRSTPHRERNVVHNPLGMPNASRNRRKN